jgi:metallo-beta-lactamase family protein
MKITFHGAAQTVTGSQHLLEINGATLLLDCGLYQGPRTESEDRNRNLPYTAAKVDAVILSHAHIDHLGNLPNLAKSGFNGPIYTTRASADLGHYMLLDSAHIQEADAEFVSRKRAERHQPPVEPLYTIADANRALDLFHPVDYEQVFEPAPGVVCRLVEAGHILGSSAVALDIQEHGRKFRLWFSGDIGRFDLPLLRDPVLPNRPDYLIMESTYGDKVHRDPELAYIELRDALNRTLKRGGKVIIPAFAVGRTQELVYDLQRMFTGGEVGRVPVYVDSPLAVNASDVFRAHPECFDDETKQFLHHNREITLLGFNNLIYTRSVEESKALNGRKEPMIIISAAGMAENGRIRHHLANNIEDPINTILIVSWQAPNTLGRQLADRLPRVRIFGEVYERKAEVVTIGGLSAHAGQTGLLDYARACQGTVKQVFLVHGEAGPAGVLMGKMKEMGMRNISYPEMHSSVEV